MQIELLLIPGIKFAEKDINVIYSEAQKRKRLRLSIRITKTFYFQDVLDVSALQTLNEVSRLWLSGRCLRVLREINDYHSCEIVNISGS